MARGLRIEVIQLNWKNDPLISVGWSGWSSSDVLGWDGVSLSAAELTANDIK